MAKELINYPILYDDANLLGYWRLEGNSNDSKGSNNGTDTSITYSTDNGRFGQGAGFDGTNSYITLGNYNNAATDMSVNVWVKYTVADATSVAIYGQYTGGNELWGISQDSSGATGKMQANSFRGSGAGGTATKVSTSALNDGAWHMITAVWDGAAGSVELFVDGASNGSQGGAGTGGVLSNNNATSVGAQGTANKWTGSIDETAIWTRKLTSTEISDFYNAIAFIPQIIII